MCGRFASFSSTDDIARAFAVELVLQGAAPSWNVAPTHEVSVVVEAVDEDQSAPLRTLRTARWGFVPSWATSISGPPLINARAETLVSKPSFRAAAKRHRAIVPANGYYEWTGTRAAKVPFFLHASDDGLLGFAGVYDWWRVADEWLCSVAIVTRPATDTLGHIHDRMPLVVPSDLVDAWLDPSLTSADGVDALLHSIPDPDLAPRRVGPEVGSVRNDHPGLIVPV